MVSELSELSSMMALWPSSRVITESVKAAMKSKVTRVPSVPEGVCYCYLVPYFVLHRLESLVTVL